MKYKDLMNLFESKDVNTNKLYKYASFEWVIDLLKDGRVYSYDDSIKNQLTEDSKLWIAMTTKRSSSINHFLPEYGPCEIIFDKKLLKINNEVYDIKFDIEWLDKRPSIIKFLSRKKYESSKDYFRKNYDKIDWKNRDNFSIRFFGEYLKDGILDIDKLLDEVEVSEIEDYIYDINYKTFKNFLKSVCEEDELVLIKSPLVLVNDAILQITVPRRYKEKIKSYEVEYKIRYE